MAIQRRTANRHFKFMLWTVIAIVLGATLLPMTGYMYVGASVESAPSADDTNPRANYWRAVREGNEGYVSSQGPYTTRTLIQNGGQVWRQIRNGPVSTFTPWILATVLGLIVLFHVVVGRVKLEEARSGKVVKRWSLGERVLHWYTAILFVILAITGLSMLFGRAVLIPLLGPVGFSAWASFSITLHNYLGPFFCVGVVMEIVLWMRHNIPTTEDFKWLARGGGLLGKNHVSAGRINGGEKLWFWIICTIGVVTCVTGVILNFPNFEQTLETMQIASIVHVVAANVWLAVAIGHMWIGTLGTEGSLEAMTSGQVSEEWAKQHHDRWLEEVKAKEG